MTTIAEAFTLAVAAHESGRVDEAVGILHAILEVSPDHPGCLHLHGIIAKTAGDDDGAADYFSRAIVAAPHIPDLHHLLGVCQHRRGRLENAAVSLERALALAPDNAAVLVDLGRVRIDQNRVTDALDLFRAALAVEPTLLPAMSNLGNALLVLDRYEEAIPSFHQAIAIDPTHALAHSSLGSALNALGRYDEATACFQRALEIDPGHPLSHNGLGLIHLARNQPGQALAHFERAVALAADYIDAHVNAGLALLELDRPTEAIDRIRQALALKPDNVMSLNNLGNALKDHGRLAEAMESYVRALAVEPDYLLAHTNLLMCMHYSPETSPAAIAATARRWADRVGAHASPETRKAVDPKGRLRIGFLSADLINHPVGYFIAPVLEHHDRVGTEVTCYCDSPRPDAMTNHLRAASDRWRSTVGMSDEAVAALVREDGIDILVDLSGHAGGTRLPVFARRPAPVQVTWIGYCGSTGLAAMDYILADDHVVRPGEEHLFTETVWRLPGTYLCYGPPRGVSVEVSPLPAADGHPPTFGSLNNRVKITPHVVALWARALSAVPGSRLLLKSFQYGDPGVREGLRAAFASHGIAGDRLILEARSPWPGLFTTYHRIDVALDTFPFGGGITTLEALWMGVPVVTLDCDRWAGRVSETILHAVGLGEMVATDPDDYVARAAALVADLPRLADLRAGLRTRLLTSPMCDGKGFAARIEAAWRAMTRAAA
ncbi:MAG: tetratricopeptide repeat protein [Alphaproteobacteria bacterium]